MFEPLAKGERIRMINTEEPMKIVRSKRPSAEPVFYEFDDGTVLPLFSDADVYDATKELFLDSLEANIEAFLGLEPKPHLPGVAASVEKNPLLSEIRMTTGAYNKVVRGAELIGAGRYNVPELSYHLLSHEDAPEGLVTDAVVGLKQVVSGSMCRALAYLDLMYTHEDRFYAGWCHSHGSHKTFHSEWDDANVKQQVGSYNLTQEFSFSGYVCEIQYLPSVVVNARGDDPFGAICIQYVVGEEKTCFIKRDVPIVLVEEEYPLDDSDESLLEAIAEVRIQ